MNDQDLVGKIQKKALGVYKEFKAICDEHGLRYYSSGGTTIGAVLHHGIIPWDDDIDINMPRPDYERFKQIAKRELPGWLDIIDGETDPYADFHFIKLHDTRTMYTSTVMMDFPESYNGIFIDIEPIDGAPDDENERKRFYEKIDKWRKQDLARKFTTYLHREVMSDLVGQHEWMWPLYACYLRLFPRNYFAKKHIKLFKKYPFNTSRYVAFSLYNISHPDSFPRKLQQANWGDGIEFPFEDTTIKVPGDYEKLMVAQYGFLPTKKTQEQYIASYHHLQNAIIDPERSYKEYQEETVNRLRG